MKYGYLLLSLISLAIGGKAQNQYALDFDGINDKVIIPNATTLNFGNTLNFTIETWIKLDGSQANNTVIIGKASTGGSWQGYQLSLFDNRITASINTGNTLIGVSNGFIGLSYLNDDAWHHVALVVSRTDTVCRLFVDGILEASIKHDSIRNNISNSASLLIGTDRNESLFFNGIIDEMRIWNTARTSSEIANQKNTELSASTSGLIANYQFNTSSGTTLTDITSNAFHGTLENFTLTGSASNWVYSGAHLSYYSQSGGDPFIASKWNSRPDGSGTNAINLTSPNYYVVQGGHVMTTTSNYTFGTEGARLIIQKDAVFNANHAITTATEALLQLDSGSLFYANVNQVIGSANMIGGRYILDAGKNLTINGNVTTIGGVIRGTSTSTLTISNYVGTLLFDQSIPGTSNVFHHVVMGTGSDASMTIGNALIIPPTGSIIFHAAGTKSLTIASNLTLKSNSTGSAYIGNTNGATISGNVTVERFIPNTRRAYRFLASPVTTADIWSNWQESGAAISGCGTHITGIVSATPGNDATTGLDRTIIGGSSMFTFVTPTWRAITNTKTTGLTPGVGYRVLIRGDRTIDLNAIPNPTPNPTVLRATGSLATGNVTTATLPTGYNLIGNPYACAINWDASGWASARSNITNTVWIYDPAVTASTSGTVYATWNNGSGTNGMTDAIIRSGQAFFIRTTSWTTLTFTQSYKVTNQTGGFFKKSQSNHLRVALQLNGVHADDIVIRFRPDGQKIYDLNYDANSLGSNIFGICSLKDTNRLAIQTLPDISQNAVTVPLSVQSDVTGNFQLKFTELETFNPDIAIALKDKYLQTTQNISANFSYDFIISADTNSKGDNRFELVFKKSSTGVWEPIGSNDFNISPNPCSNALTVSAVKNGLSICQYTICNLLGETMQSGVFNFGLNQTEMLNTETLMPGVYMLQLAHQDKHQTIKFVRK
jgi:hypothetical protein